MSGKACALFFFVIVGVSWTSGNPAMPSEGNQNGPACPLIAGCTSQDQCQEGPNGCSCGVSRPSLLNACHWPKVSEMGEFCGRVGSTPDCSCPHSHGNDTAGEAFCPILPYGCSTGGDGTCAGNPMSCIVPDSIPTMCYWPPTSGGTCMPDPAHPPIMDCLCPNDHGMGGHLPVCPIVSYGCSTGGDGTCGGNPMSCIVPDTTPMMCYWPPVAGGTCMPDPTQNPQLVDCACAPDHWMGGHLPECPMILGCTFFTGSCTAGNGMQCDMSDATQLSWCHWPSAAGGTCQSAAGVYDCMCEPAF